MENHTIRRLPAELRLVICSYLEVKDLSSFSKTCRVINPYAREQMYRQDAATQNSSAILWAAGASGVSGDYSAAAVSVLRYSVQFGGDVNARHYMNGDATCTAIHVAAAHGNKSFVEELLRLGALIDTYSLRLWRFLNVDRYNRGLGIARKLHEFCQSTGLQCCFPLLPAMFRPTISIASLLIQNNHNGRLAIRHQHVFMPPLREAPRIDAAYTIHHLLVEQDLFPEWRNELFRRFRDCISVPTTSGGGISPLMRAVQKGNESAVEILLSFPQDLNAATGLGWTVLSYAVEGASMLHMPKARDWSASLVTRLLKDGADVNIGGASSPLQLAVTSAVEDEIVTDPRHRKRMLDMIKVLLMHEANVNVRMEQGQLLGHYVFQQIEKGIGLTLLRLLFIAILNHGMNVHEPFPEGTSFLARSLRLASSPAKNVIIPGLIVHGACPEPHEYNDILRRWLLTSKDSKKNMLPKEVEEKLPEFAPHFSQEAVDEAFTKLILDQDKKRFDILMQFRQTSRPSSLLALAIQNRFPRRAALYELPFEPAWQNMLGRSYPHLVMQGLEEGIYDEKAAVEEIERLIQAGVSLWHQDGEGLTVLQWLSRIQQELRERSDKPDVLGKLEKLLFRQRLKELGEI